MARRSGAAILTGAAACARSNLCKTKLTELPPGSPPSAATRLPRAPQPARWSGMRNFSWSKINPIADWTSAMVWSYAAQAQRSLQPAARPELSQHWMHPLHPCHPSRRECACRTLVGVRQDGMRAARRRAGSDRAAGGNRELTGQDFGLRGKLKYAKRRSNHSKDTKVQRRDSLVTHKTQCFPSCNASCPSRLKPCFDEDPAAQKIHQCHRNSRLYLLGFIDDTQCKDESESHNHRPRRLRCRPGRPNRRSCFARDRRARARGPDPAGASRRCGRRRTKR